MSDKMFFLQEKLYNIYKYLKYPEKLFCKINEYDNYRYAKYIPDKIFLKFLFKKTMKEKLDLSNPHTFSEKIQWLKLYDRNPNYTIMADKFDVKKYVAEHIGDEYIIPTIGVFDSVEAIPFLDLPAKCVIKCTHDSGSTIIFNGKNNCDLEKVKEKLSKCLARNFYWYGREWVYKDIPARIIVEEFISDEEGNSPVDYKFFCFYGKMQFFKIDYNRFTKRVSNYYDRNCEYLDFGKIYSIPDPNIELKLPDNFQEMVEIAEKLSKGIPFLRVDLYSVKGKIYFGELTFYPSSGIERFTGDGDNIMGEYLELPKGK